MSSHFLLIGFGLWVVFSAWRGFRKGFWRGLFSLMSLVVAYLVSFVFGGSFSESLGSLDFYPEYAVFVGYPLLFIITAQCIRHAPFLLFPALKNNQGISAVGGAVLGAFTGAVSGLIVIWGIGFVKDMKPEAEPAEQPIAEKPVGSNKQVQTIASSVVGKVFEVGLSAASKSEQETNLMSAVMSQPGPMIKNIQGLMRSPEMGDFVRDPEMQERLAAQDIGGIVSSPLFDELIKKPELQPVIAAMSDGDADLADNERFIAEKMSFIWKRVETVKADPELMSLMNDPDVQKTLEGGSPLSVMTNQKVRSLIAIMFERGVLDGDDVADTNSAAEAEPVKIYRWVDNQGQLQFSDWEHIPVSKRAEAELSH